MRRNGFSKLFFAYFFVFLLSVIPIKCNNDNDNEFAEFEDNEIIEKDEFKENKILDLSESDGVVEEDEDEFSDSDEFDRGERPLKKTGNDEVKGQQPLKFADVPSHFRLNWASYQVEAIIIVLIFVYMLNYVMGRSKNQTLANEWFKDVSSLLEGQFAVVGDDGVSTDLEGGHLIKETDSSFFIWCTGRAGCQGMLIHLKLLKRQDLVSVIINMARSKQDKAIIRIDIDNTDMDSFVLAAGARKSLIKAVKEYTDLSLYAVERKGLEKLGLPPSVSVFAEIPETIPAVIDPTVQSVLRKYEKAIDYLHISDQYSGYKPSENETYTQLPETSKVLIFVLNITADPKEKEALMRTIFYCFEKLRKHRLSREGKIKADKKRQNVNESFMRTTHQARQEAAQARKEEKTRERKQKLLEEEDPEKQRKLEKIEQKRDSKMRQPKIKQLKVKQ